MLLPRYHLLLFAATFVVLLFLFHFGIPGLRYYWHALAPNGVTRFSDFEQENIRTLSSSDVPTSDPNRRVIIVGDIHGMKTSLDKLLTKIAYDDHYDVLIHTGDILSKGPHNGSMQVIRFMTTRNVTGVRGNHDQEVINWRIWIEEMNRSPEGKLWFSNLHSKWLAAEADGNTLKEWVRQQRSESIGQDSIWWSRIPKDWTPFGHHYRIADELTDEEYAYLLSLPLKLHIPSIHTFIVHAGLLPSDVRYDYDDHRRQPLARVPSIPTHGVSHHDDKIQTLRFLQETGVLHRVPQNTIPWANLNLRSILENKEMSRKPRKGKPWPVYWNTQMSMCSGFGEELDLSDMNRPLTPGSSDEERKSLPCYPSSVIYGHTASRGLDIAPWSFGLDTGCAHGRELTAMILGPVPLPDKVLHNWDEDEQGEEDGRKEMEGYDEDMDWDDDDDDGDYDDDDDDNDDDDDDIVGNVDNTYGVENGRFPETVKFGDQGRATIVRVSCLL